MFAKSLLTGFAAGAGAMYFFDAAQGKRRRKLVADQFNRLAHDCLHSFDVACRDLKNRTQGAMAHARGLMASDDASDETIVQRVRSTIGHVLTHPRLIEVGCSGGHVVLRGPVPRSELFGLLRAASSVHGVRTVADELTIADHLGNGSENGTSQGLAGSSSSFFGNWSPGTKLLVGGVGAVLLGNCLMARRRSLSDAVLGTLGFGLLVRSLAPANQAEASSWSRVEFHKTLSIHAPVEKVFGFITTPANWLTISNKIRNLDVRSQDEFAKDIALPGMNLHCSERITRRQENECFMTESLPDSMLSFQKQLHFEPQGDHTRVHLKFAYSPPGGIVGHGVASLLGFDAKSFFDDFLMRAKTYLETGLQPHDVAKMQYGQRMATDAGPNVPPHERAPNQREGSEISPLGSPSFSE